MTIGKNVRFNLNGFTDDALDGEAPTVNFGLYMLDDHSGRRSIGHPKSVSRGAGWQNFGSGKDVGARVFPSWNRRGGCAIKKKNPFRNGADGVVILESMLLDANAVWESTNVASTTQRQRKNIGKNSVTH